MAKCPSKYEGAHGEQDRHQLQVNGAQSMTDQGVPFSPIALVGTIALLAAYVVAAWCVAAGIAGNARKSRRLVTLVGLRPLRLRRADRPRVGADDLRVRHARLLDQVRRARRAIRRCRPGTRSPRSGAASTARCCSGCSCSSLFSTVAIVVNAQAPPRHDRLRRRDDHGRAGVLPVAPDLHEEPVRDVPDRAAGRRPGPEPAAPELLDGHPSAVALHRLRRRDDSVRVRHRRARVGPARRSCGSARSACGC